MKQLIQLLLFGMAMGAWQDGAEIKSYFKEGEIQTLGSFEGHSEDHLTLLGQSRNSLFIGGRDGLYNLSRVNLTPQSVLNWTVSADHQEICQIKGQKESECHNFVRIFFGPLTYSYSPKVEALPSGESKYLVCGTHAFKPKCRWYSSDFKTFSSEFSGIGYSPFSPSSSSSSLLHHGSVYAATMADFGGTDALIYKQPLRTEQYYDLHLNSPSFVSSLSFGDLALFFFREFAVEHTNCGKAVFSRVARICRHDTGSRKHKDRFTTFLKARLNCSIPGEFPFYFDHIQSTTDIFMNSQRSEEMLYAVFTTSPNSIGASAVCAFSTKDILKAFDGPFKGQSSIDSNWLPVSEGEVPKPRPGSCSNDPSYSPDSTSAAFVKGHPLMDDAVQGTAVLTSTSNTDHFTAIAIDPSPEISPFHILYLGTATGKVLKAVINATASGYRYKSGAEFGQGEGVISQSWDIFPGSRIKSLHLSKQRRLFVGTETQLRIIAVDNCQEFTSCQQCVGIRDPHCAWNPTTQECTSLDMQNKSAGTLQNVNNGSTEECPNDETSNEVVAVEPNSLKNEVEEDETKDCCSCTPMTTTSTSEPSSPTKDSLLAEGGIDAGLIINLLPQDPIIENVQVQNNTFEENEIPRLETGYTQDFKSSFVRSDDNFVSSRSLVLATTSTAGIALIIGFILGFVVSRLIFSKQDEKKPATNAQLASLNEAQRLTKPIDFVLNVPSVNKVPVKNNLNTGTLEKTVKKIYL